MVLNEFVPVVVDGRLNAILIVALYTFVGGLLYFVITYKSLFKNIFGEEIINKIFKKFKKNNS